MRDYDYTCCRQLAAAIALRAVNDIKSQTNDYYSRSAIEFLWSQDGALILDILGIDMQTLSAAIDRFLAENEPQSATRGLYKPHRFNTVYPRLVEEAKRGNTKLSRLSKLVNVNVQTLKNWGTQGKIRIEKQGKPGRGGNAWHMVV